MVPGVSVHAFWFQIAHSLEFLEQAQASTSLSFRITSVEWLISKFHFLFEYIQSIFMRQQTNNYHHQMIAQLKDFLQVDQVFGLTSNSTFKIPKQTNMTRIYRPQSPPRSTRRRQCFSSSRATQRWQRTIWTTSLLMGTWGRPPWRLSASSHRRFCYLFSPTLPIRRGGRTSLPRTSPTRFTSSYLRVLTSAFCGRSTANGHPWLMLSHTTSLGFLNDIWSVVFLSVKQWEERAKEHASHRWRNKKWQYRVCSTVDKS